jgi:hypothetical protein
MLFRSATMPRSKSESGIAGPGALRNPFPVARRSLAKSRTMMSALSLKPPSLSRSRISTRDQKGREF